MVVVVATVVVRSAFEGAVDVGDAELLGAVVVSAEPGTPDSSAPSIEDSHAVTRAAAATSKWKPVRRTKKGTVATGHSRSGDARLLLGAEAVWCENRRVQQLVAALGIVVVALVIAAVVRRHRPDPPSQPSTSTYEVPAQLDRADFDRGDAPWLVAVFTSASCGTCAGVRAKAAVLESSEVAVVDVEYGAAKALHERYGIDAVPTLVVADHHGVVRCSFVGPMTATDLWAAVAEVRQPGATPEPHLGRGGNGDERPQSSG